MIVTDGFTGNVFLKTVKNRVVSNGDDKGAGVRQPQIRLGALLMKPVFSKVARS